MSDYLSYYRFPVSSNQFGHSPLVTLNSKVFHAADPVQTLKALKDHRRSEVSKIGKDR